MFLRFRKRNKPRQTRLTVDISQIYRPTPHQLEVQQHIDAGRKCVFFIGGRRSGKTYCGSWEFVRYIVNHPEPPHLSWIVAPTYKIARTVTRYFLDNPLVQATMSYQDRRDQVYELSLPILEDGKVIGTRRETVEVRTAREPDALRGVGVKVALLDEGASLSKEAFDVLQPVLLDTNALLLVTTTPKARNWLFAEYLARQNDPNFALVTCRTEDNPYISHKAVAELRARYSAKMAAQELDAQFVAAAGLVYNVPDTQFIDDYTDELRDCVITGGCDFGFRDPFAFLWIAYNMRTGHYTVLDEYYQTRKTFEENLRAIKGHPLTRLLIRVWCDPHDPDNIARMRKEGIHAVPAVSRDITIGIDAVQTLFDSRRLFIVKRCKNMVWELGTYAYRYEDEDADIHKNINDRPVDYANHACDALRYCIESDLTVNRQRRKSGDRELAQARKRIHSLMGRVSIGFNPDWEDGIPLWAEQ